MLIPFVRGEERFLPPAVGEKTNLHSIDTFSLLPWDVSPEGNVARLVSTDHEI